MPHLQDWHPSGRSPESTVHRKVAVIDCVQKTGMQRQENSVRWDHFWMDELTLSINNERINMHYSRCLVNVKCGKGKDVLPVGIHIGARDHGELDGLRRCKNDPAVLNTTCTVLTDFDIAKARFQQQQEDQQSDHEKERSLRSRL